MKNKIKTDFRTSFENELITSFSLCLKWLSNVKDDPYQWKWVMIFFHNALQNLMVKELGEDIQLILKPGVAQDLLKSIQAQKKMTRRWEMDFFMELVKKVGRFKRYTQSQEYKLSDLELGCMKYLNAFRNNMIHFASHSYSENVALFPRILLSGIAISEFAIQRSGNIIWFKKRNEKITGDLIKNLKKRLISLDKYYSLPFQGIPKDIEEAFLKL